MRLERLFSSHCHAGHRLTGHDEPGLAAPVRSLGASAYLMKPVDETALLSAIKTAITPTNPSRA